MSFRDLREEIHLVLQIKGGHGFGFVTQSLIVTANLAGNIHESFVTEPCPQPKFESEFVWVMDKTKMKSIWSDKTPVRVECFTVSEARRNRVGYAILNVKDAQVVKNESKITEKQVRLLGLSKEASLLKPELFIYFYITDIPIQKPSLVPQVSPRPVSGTVAMTDGAPRITLGLAREYFSLSISVDAINNLKMLLPSQSDVDRCLVTLTYSLLGLELLSSSASDHTARLVLVSSFACLKTYFIQHPFVSVKLHLDNLLLGETKLNMENLLLTEEPHSRKTKHHTRSMSCRCLITPSHSVNELQPNSRPSLDFTVNLICDAPIVKKTAEVKPSNSLSSVGAGGDATSFVLPLQVPLTHPITSRSQSNSVGGGGETYRTQPTVHDTYTASVTVNSLKLDNPHTHQYWLRLNQACGRVSPKQLYIPQSWKRLQYQLTVSVSRQLFEVTLSAHPTILQLGVGDHVVAEANISPPGNLFSNSKQGEYTTQLLNEGVRVGEVGVVWAVDEADKPSQSAPLPLPIHSHTDTSLSPLSHSAQAVEGEALSPRARELKILSFVEELEDWAEKQRIMVMEGLKEEEAAHLASLQTQWEKQVGGQLTEGRQLVEALHNMRDQLKQQEKDLQDNQLKLKVYKEELERIHRSKLQEFRDLSRRMQEEFNHKLALIASDKVEVEREVEKFREENNTIKQQLRVLETKSDTDKRVLDGLNHEMKILKEKLLVEQESKNFFKEHCRKAEQEIHRLNCLRQQELEAQLHSEKKSLEKLAFKQVVLERNDLRNDERILEEIRQQLFNRDVNTDENLSLECSSNDQKPDRSNLMNYEVLSGLKFVLEEMVQDTSFGENCHEQIPDFQEIDSFGDIIYSDMCTDDRYIRRAT